MYPHLTEPEIDAIRDFIQLYQDEIGYNEVLHGGERSIPPTTIYEENPRNQLFSIRQLTEPAPHPNSRIKNVQKILSKMKPRDARILNNAINDMTDYMIKRSKEIKKEIADGTYDDSHFFKDDDRKKKPSKAKPKRKVTRKCKCK